MLQKKYAYSAEVTNIEKGNLANTEQLSQLRYQTEENTTNGLIKLDKTRLESNQALIGGISSGLQGLSQLAKKDSVAAKSLAAAGALIDTYAAITGILKSTAKTAAGGIPGYAIAQAVATGIFGMVQVRNILKTNVDGKGTGGDTSSISAPSLSTAPVINASAAQQQSVQDVRVTNQNQAPVRAYI
ncbi:MAG: hypothetical protein LC127_15565, partial [Chitinophagales bacterium]|nr:hypothetical protein [Chitinophagales bacterium]